MRIVLSRKGFDSSVGGHASPILPDGRMISLPIPSSFDRLQYGELKLPDGGTYAQLIDELGAAHRIGACGAHLDPDLIKSTRTRKRGWRASLGQIGAAAGHLRNQAVGVGDLFLFYGWFRHAERVDDRLRFVAGTEGFHAIFGYLEVGDVINASDGARLPAWLQDHPHAEPHRVSKPTNTIYVAAARSSRHPDEAGAGVFRFDDALVLTMPGHSRSRWNLARSLFQHLEISYHTQEAWRADHFQSYPRAQEYVVLADGPLIDWAYGLIGSSGRWS